MLFTIGHSNHSFEQFLRLLKIYNIEVLTDVRSVPASRYTPQFNGVMLKNALLAHGIRYLWLEDLGGRPKNKDHFDAQGHADYRKMAQASEFLSALSRLEMGCAKYQVAIMCSEENPNECHRRLLVVRALVNQNPEYAQFVQHIRGDGLLSSEVYLAKSEYQQDNFFAQEATLWRSPKPIPLGSQERVLNNFLES